MRLTMGHEELRRLGYEIIWDWRKRTYRAKGGDYYKLDDEIKNVKYEYIGKQLDFPSYRITFFLGDSKMATVSGRGVFVLDHCKGTYYEIKDGKKSVLSSLTPCADPRLLATMYLSDWLLIMFLHLGKRDVAEREIPKIRHVFTQEEALEWLDKNGLTSEFGNAIFADIWRGLVEMTYVPPHLRELYDTYADEYRRIVKENREKYGGTFLEDAILRKAKEEEEKKRQQVVTLRLRYLGGSGEDGGIFEVVAPWGDTDDVYIRSKERESLEKLCNELGISTQVEQCSYIDPVLKKSTYKFEMKVRRFAWCRKRMEREVIDCIKPYEPLPKREPWRSNETN